MSATTLAALEQLIAWAELDLTRDSDPRSVVEDLLDSLTDLALDEGGRR